MPGARRARRRPARPRSHRRRDARRAARGPGGVASGSATDSSGIRAGRPRTARRAACAPSSRGRGAGEREQLERGILRQDAALELVQRRVTARCRTPPTSASRVLPVDLERLGLAPRPVEREHQLAAETLAQRVVPDERLELAEHGDVPAELRAPRRSAARARRAAAPRAARSPSARTTRRRDRRAERRARARALGRAASAALCASPASSAWAASCVARSKRSRSSRSRLDVQDVAGRARLDRLGAEGLAQLRDLPLHLRHGGHRRRAGVEVVGEPLDRDDAVRAQEQDRERRPLLRPAEADRAIRRRAPRGVRGAGTRARARR